MKSFETAEANFAAKRAANLVDAPKSGDVPLGGREIRRLLCLNGEWEGTRDGGKSWLKVRLPNEVVGHESIP